MVIWTSKKLNEFTREYNIRKSHTNLILQRIISIHIYLSYSNNLLRQWRPKRVSDLELSDKSMKGSTDV